MSEPEEVILDGAHAATMFAAKLWRRHYPGPERLFLPDIRLRLELLTGALFGDTPPIIAAEAPAIPSFARRIAHRIPSHMLDDTPHASSDGVRIRLPAEILAAGGRDAATARYRLLAVEQAVRVNRGTSATLQQSMPREARDLFLLSEAVAVDHWIATELRGFAADIAAARREALRQRPPLRVFTDRERRVELLLRSILESDPETIPESIPLAADPEGSLEWARELAREVEQEKGRYRGLPSVALWGGMDPLPPDAVPRRKGFAHSAQPRHSGERVANMRRRPRVRQEQEDEDDSEMGMWMIQLDDPSEHVEDPMGLQRPTDQDHQADADDLADSLSELPEARLVAAPGSPAEVLASADPPERRPLLVEGEEQPVGYAYPEWDFRIGAYHPGRAIVRELSVPRGEPRWVEGVLRHHAASIALVRRRFERLQPQRLRLSRQLDGDELDISAYAMAHADARANGRADDRLYQLVRPSRRDIAVTLLVDISGSTDSWLSDKRRIIDVEKEAVLLLCEALDALGDRYSISAFSGEGPGGVAIYPLKRFGERYSMDVKLRVAGLEHDRYTRMGAALRHATAQLAHEAARHRLLLMLTDGKPNDVDIYEGRYGIEDARQAVAEARLQGLQPFCITVDREAPYYLPRIFGPGGSTVLRRAETLPNAIVDVVRRLLRG